ncbi:pyridoxal phosphate-dependent decarboxylase family protein [Arthrobacter sp. LS16]|uniref:pyridoxal phosphate-dependent decarboxylase family protein n=1 Tax=Arthrobacter sp. 'calajunan' TaxID=1690248 RepID=UPI003C7873A6
MGTPMPSMQRVTVDSPPGDSSLLCAQTAAQFETETARVVSHVAAQLSTVASPATGATPDQLRPAIEAVDLNSPLGNLTEALEEIQHLYLRDAIYFHDTRYAAHLNCPVAIPAAAIEAVVTSVNTSMDTFDQSAGATLIERKLVDWTAGLIGFDVQGADGIFTSGGTQSNLQAMLIARNIAASKLDGPLPHRLSRLRIYCSADAHFSIRDAAMLLGLGSEAAVAIPTDCLHRMDPAALRRQIDADLQAGLQPMSISATAGTTDFGAIDPLLELRRIASEHGTWLHVDAAYGCGLLISRHHRSRLAGIESADSVTVDYHKSFFQPIGSSALILARGRDFGCIAHYAEYLNPRSEAAGSANQVDKSLQTTRRFDALKLWTTLRTLGADRLGSMFDQVIELAEMAEREVALRDELRLAAPVQLSTLVFAFNPPHLSLPQAQKNQLADQIRHRLYASGEAMIAATTHDGERLLKLTLLNPNTSLSDISAILDAICKAGREVLSDFEAGVSL